MSVFNPGSGILTSTTLPAAMLEISALLEQAESAVVSDNPPDNLTLNSNIDLKEFTIAMTLPITASVNSSGQAVIIAVDYLSAAGGDSTLDNTGGDLNSTNLVSAALEIASLLHAEEKQSNPEIDNIQITYNLENGTADIQSVLPQSSTVSDGSLVITAVDYI